ncbi:MAG: DUF262 domain-containing protein [Scytonematopsis contorta HA4267-MV1]|jgi:uncharacterized protein YlaI|nr:DUF262 domain-containing protein [Scytonematopsis contorta HA4267-MV1]
MVVQQDRIGMAEEQINNKRQEIDYDTREFTIEIVVSKYLEKDDDDLSEIYVPEYQREFVWDTTRQSRLIESIILGLPIPLIFVAEIEETGRLEIVDGSQRIRTLAAFMTNKLQLSNLRTLDYLNGFCFNDLALSRQRKFKNTPIRMIVLSEKVDERVRNDVFDRINTSSLDLTPMETRKGVYRGDFIDFVFECTKNELFIELCPVSKYFQNRYEEAELVLRFFAFSETYPEFCFLDGSASADLERTGVARFLDEYIIWKNKNFQEEEKNHKLNDFNKMLDFVKKTFPSAFKKYYESDATSRSYFEAISVGSHLALQQNHNLVVKGLWKTLDKSNQINSFIIPISRYQTHKPDNIRKRIDYVKDKLLGKI